MIEKERKMAFVENIPAALVKTRDGKVFQKGEKLRKRYKCTEVATKKLYLLARL
jgi:hypothetical protein